MFMPYAYRLKPSSSEERLERLIQERVAPGADKDAIDRRIWDLFGDEWAVMFTDLSGFSRGVAQFGIVHFLQIIHESMRLLTPCIEAHDGILLKVEADSLMVIFRRPERALDCAVSMQKVLAGYNVDRADTDRILLCVGLGFGKMLRIGDHDVFGAEVNASSKLGEDIAESGEILVTDSVKNAVLTAGRTLKFDKHPTIPPGASAAWKLQYSV